MKVLFKNKTKYSMENYEEFLRFHQEKYGLKYTISTIIIMLLLIFCIIAQLKSKSFYPLAFTVIILIVFLVYRYYQPREIIKKEKKSKKIKNEQEFIFKFYNKYFLIYSQKVFSKIRYFKLYKIFETQDFFYLYLDKTHSFLISKEGFEKGTPEEFRKFINKKCKFKMKDERKKIMNTLLIIILKLLNIILKIFGKQGGNILGKLAKKFNPNILEFFKVDCPVIAVTATNGKTSTNNQIAYTLETAGYKVLSNKKGNNMETGIISVLIKNSTLTGKVKADFITFEVDENYVPIIFSKCRLDTLVILDFFRDQLDRNGTVETLIGKINEFLKDYQRNLVLNSDDPNVSRLSNSNPENKNVYFYSVEKYEKATEKMEEAGEGRYCPFCDTKLEYEYYQYSHIGKFKCPKCGFGSNEIYKLAQNINLKEKTFEVDGIKYKINENSIYTIYNYMAVLAVMNIYNIEPEMIIKAFETFNFKNGRLETISVKGMETTFNLAKNPTGGNVSLKLLEQNTEEKELLFAVNDKIADGIDVSWIWDINFEAILDKNVTKIVTAGDRAYDLAIRFKIAGFDIDKIIPCENYEDAVEELYKNKNRKYIIANYTALQPLRTMAINYDKTK